MANFFRMILGLALLPACWGAGRTLMDAVVAAAGGADAFSVETFSLLGGMAAFVLCWFAIPHPVRTYVLGHELTHALWGLAFGAVPTKVRVTERGGWADDKRSETAMEDRKKQGYF